MLIWASESFSPRKHGEHGVNKKLFARPFQTRTSAPFQQTLRAKSSKKFLRALCASVVNTVLLESLLLTLGTVMTAASCDDNPLDGSFADETRLSFASVNLVF